MPSRIRYNTSLKTKPIEREYGENPTILTKYCISCEKTYNIEHFHKDKYSTDGYAHRCKKCVSNLKKISALKQNFVRFNVYLSFEKPPITLDIFQNYAEMILLDKFLFKNQAEHAIDELFSYKFWGLTKFPKTPTAFERWMEKRQNWREISFCKYSIDLDVNTPEKVLSEVKQTILMQFPPLYIMFENENKELTYIRKRHVRWFDKFFLSDSQVDFHEALPLRFNREQFTEALKEF